MMIPATFWWVVLAIYWVGSGAFYLGLSWEDPPTKGKLWIWIFSICVKTTLGGFLLPLVVAFAFGVVASGKPWPRKKDEDTTA